LDNYYLFSAEKKKDSLKISSTPLHRKKYQKIFFTPKQKKVLKKVGIGLAIVAVAVPLTVVVLRKLSSQKTPLPPVSPQSPSSLPQDFFLPKEPRENSMEPHKTERMLSVAKDIETLQRNLQFYSPGSIDHQECVNQIKEFQELYDDLQP
jgi:hypothetical protein